MESLLFGHERGAFTGADSAKKGLFEQANRGTLFIDEIHNLNLAMQSKLLNFLQDHTVLPVGSQKPVTLDLHIIVATNVSLEEMIGKGLFREDLFYRIAVTTLHLPRLNERPEDIPLLIRYFTDTFNLKYHKSIRGLAPAAFKAVYDYPWPGNIRELKNAIERAFLLCGGKTITKDLLGLPEVDAAASTPGRGREKRARKPHHVLDADRSAIVRLFRKHHGMVNRMVKELNVTRSTLYRYFKKYGITPNELRKNPRQRKSAARSSQ
jgi:transcriptional regulator with PAS, ATPase and Fis domain